MIWQRNKQVSSFVGNPVCRLKKTQNSKIIDSDFHLSNLMMHSYDADSLTSSLKSLNIAVFHDHI